MADRDAEQRYVVGLGVLFERRHSFVELSLTRCEPVEDRSEHGRRDLKERRVPGVIQLLSRLFDLKTRNEPGHVELDGKVRHRSEELRRRYLATLHRLAGPLRRLNDILREISEGRGCGFCLSRRG
jgi:hypothetical protein